MVEAKTDVNPLPQQMRIPIDDLVKTIQAFYGSSAKALVLYGPVMEKSFDPQHQTARSVLVVDKVDLDILRQLSQKGLHFGKAHIAAPLIMTPPYIDQSRDTFPLELIEIHQQHLTLFGQEYFDKLEFEDRHVRLQCERDLKAILMGLRQGLLASAGKDKFLAPLEMDVGAGLVRTLRGFLWLHKQRGHRLTLEIVKEVESVLDRRLTGIRTALDPLVEHGWTEFQRLYDDVAVLGEKVNGW